MNDAAMWSAIALVAVISTGTLFLTIQRLDALATRLDVRFDAVSGRIETLGVELSGRIDWLSSRIDAQGAELGARLDAMSARLDDHIGRHAS